MSRSTIYPVILSGGAGSRLWPLSRALYPKQLLPLVSENSLIQETALRFKERPFGRSLVICNEAHRFIIAQQLHEAEVSAPRLVLEPVGRNTAAACIAAALILLAADPQAVMVVLPSDHVIQRPEVFFEALAIAASAAEAGHLVTFGMRPSGPETGYGYIVQGPMLQEGCFGVERFIEKPDKERAAALLAMPGVHWNSGMFVFKASVLLAEAKSLCPDIVQAVTASVKGATEDMDFLRLDATAFARAPSASIDHAIMEHTQKAAVVPADIGWSDVGSWASLWEVSDKDLAGNVAKGDVMMLDCEDCYLHGEDSLVVGVGLSNLAVITTADAVLVIDKDRAQDVGRIVERLKELKRSEGELHRKIYRPWGFYQSIDSGSRFQVKQIMILPGAQISLQMHHHRAEHWIVVEGTALITCNDKRFLLQENESTFIPLGARHRMENPGKVPLRLIEVQSGSYLGEDDIVRFQDTYGRV